MLRRRKIGILTFHRCINYGSYWQARCLAEGVRGLGRDAELLDHQCPWVDRREWRCALSPLLPERGRRRDYRLYADKARRFAGAHRRLPLSPPIGLDGTGAGSYRLVLVGSDEVWNLHHPWYGGQSLFYGAGLEAERLAAYAASFGSYDARHGLDPFWVDKLRAFAAISVRDGNSARLVQGATATDPPIVLDPCLQFPEVIGAVPAIAGRRYAVVYGHGFPTWLQQRLRRWADRRGMPLVSIGYRNDWADEQWLTAGPEEFAALIGGAAAVATNFFHGCVFALVNAKPFVCTASSYRNNKLRDLTRAVGAEQRLIDKDDDVAGLLDEPLDPAVAERLAARRESSRAYLHAVLD